MRYVDAFGGWIGDADEEATYAQIAAHAFGLKPGNRGGR